MSEKNEQPETKPNNELQTLLKIRRARETLVSALNETKSHFRERIRKLDAVEAKLFDQLDDPTDNLIPTEELLSPEILQIVENPLLGL
jgi:hypothetical protein